MTDLSGGECHRTNGLGYTKNVVTNLEGAFFIVLSLLVVLAFFYFFHNVSFKVFFNGSGSYCPYMVGV